ncbi:RagB/SusD family nutrient uptake outer membrane protein [Marinoscillum sp. MHG1-6]|uniref:RagB/SusD family nutrient uptake outer membrane protein n=1 Tax=Marinoscillum sp. MHG1-6 TaxID=2959627 RepID=UPI002157F69F|nr:RagB/SusD family nutrient uptake outer membrane protein [Marinoscillum sp. MHG1-6]
MKNIITYILIVGVLFTGCSLEEDPPFLSNENVYSTAENARAALDGVYLGLAGYDLYSNVYYFLNGLYSGYMVSRRGGNSVNTAFNTSIGSLNSSSGELNAERVWAQIYVAIARANDVIHSATADEGSIDPDQMVINDVIGQAYFVRAYSYFTLVSMWGEVPMRLAPATTETISLAKSSEAEVYSQIIKDAEMALSLMNGSAGDQYPQSLAANMLLSKVYMSLATASADIKSDTADYWQVAYDEAIKVYGQYELVGDYDALFQEVTGDNNVESIFELQSSDGASHDWVRAYTPNNYTYANTFGWLQVNADFYDLHANTYPGDPRLTTTYLTSWKQQNNGSTTNKYPVNSSRSSFANAHPFFFKLSEKDPTNEDRVGNQNIVLYRYADLLLMLAEISNELQNGEQLGYVSEVLGRVGLSPQAKYSGTQADFREAIMREYQFELLGEGQDMMTVRRRGYDWFKANIIDFHNNNVLFDPSVDVQHAEGEDVVMRLDIPDLEINANLLIQE